MNAFIAELAVYSRQGHVLVTLSDPVNRCKGDQSITAYFEGGIFASIVLVCM